MRCDRATDTQIEGIHQYLEREFPGQVINRWWDPDVNGPVFEIAHDVGQHQIEVESAFLVDCPDCLASLANSELVDYLREAHGRERRFRIRWHGQELRISSKPL